MASGSSNSRPAYILSGRQRDLSSTRPTGEILILAVALAAVPMAPAGRLQGPSLLEMQLEPEIFEGIKDKTSGLPLQAYFKLLDQARRIPPAVFERGARKDLTFAQLASAPEQYRGQTVFLKGHLRRLTRWQPRANAPGFQRLYEGWLFTDEAHDNPYVVIVSRVPQEMPLGGDIAESVSFAGYFLKLWAYEARDGHRYAPLLLGHRLVWHPRPALPELQPWTYGVMFGLMAVLFGLLLATAWWANRSMATVRQRYKTLQTEPLAEQLGDATETSTQAFLQQLEREAQLSPDD